jgi:hypothetical protein
LQLLRMHMNTTSTAPNAAIQDPCTLHTWDNSLGSLTFRNDSTLNETIATDPRDKWVPVTTAGRVLRFRMQERPPKRRVAANILNKQSRIADKVWSSSPDWGLGEMLTTPRRKKYHVTKHKLVFRTWTVPVSSG